MAVQPVTIEALAEAEDETMRNNMANFPFCYAFANNAISVISTGIVGYSASHRAFGAYLSQISVNLSLALLSALRQHKVQVYGSLRHALEHIALASYALHVGNDDVYFHSSPEDLVDHRKLLKKIVYPWFNEHYKVESERIEAVKRIINLSHAHANVGHAFRNTDGFGDEAGKLVVNFTDFHDKVSITQDLIHVGYVGFLGLLTLGEVNRPIAIIRPTSDINLRLAELNTYQRAAIMEHDEEVVKVNKL